MCPGLASVFCIVACSKSGVYFCTVINMVSWHKGCFPPSCLRDMKVAMWMCRVCRWLKGQTCCSKIKDGKFDLSADTNMSHINGKYFHVNELAEVLLLHLCRQSLLLQAQIFPSKSSGWFPCLPCWAKSCFLQMHRTLYFVLFGACGWLNGTWSREKSCMSDFGIDSLLHHNCLGLTHFYITTACGQSQGFFVVPHSKSKTLVVRM